MITEFDYRERFADKVEPLLNDILQRLDRLNIPYFFSAAVKNSETETLYERRERIPKVSNKSLANDIFPYLQKVTEGASVLQLGPREQYIDTAITDFDIKDEISTKEIGKLEKDIQILHLTLYENRICHVFFIVSNNKENKTGYFECPNLLPIVKNIKLKDDLLKRYLMVYSGFWYEKTVNEEEYFTTLEDAYAEGE